MAIKIYIKKADGKEYLWQWDKDRKIGLYDVEPSTEVHFAFCGDQTAIVVLSYSDGEDVLCDVPNILLQRGGILNVYIYRDNATIELVRIRVLARPRPEDYVYTETETLNYRELEQRITELERGGVVLPAEIEELTKELLEQISSISEELTNIRISTDGTTYASAGTAVREQIGQLVSETDSIVADFYNVSEGTEYQTVELEIISGKSIYVSDTKVSLTDDEKRAYGVADVTAGDTLLVTSTIGPSSQRTSGFAFVDNSMNLIYHYADDTLSGLLDKTDIEVIVPEGATQIYVNRLISKGDPAVTKKIENHSKSLKFDPSELACGDFENPLYGKTLLLFGDSLAYGHTLSQEETWAGKLVERNNMILVNLAQNGTTLTNADTEISGVSYSKSDSVYAKVFANAVSPVEADYIVIFAGTNDIARSVEIGEVTDDSTSATLCGALNIMLTRLIKDYPTKRICVFTPYARNADVAVFDVCKEYVTAIENVCERHSIPVFNNIKNGGVDWTNYAQLEALTMGDSYHLNAAGHEYAMHKYEAFLKAL